MVQKPEAVREEIDKLNYIKINFHVGKIFQEDNKKTNCENSI